MNERATGTTPLGDIWLIRAASLLVPAPRKPEWRRYWLGGATHWWQLLVERGELRPVAEAKLRSYTRAAVADAWKERFPGDTFQAAAGRLFRHPLFLLGWIILCLAVFTVATSGLSGTKAAFLPLPYQTPDQLFTVTQHFNGFGQLNGVPPPTFQMWQSCPVSGVSGMAAFNLRQVELGRDTYADEAVTGMQVSPDFFSVLGVRPWLGRTFEPSDYLGPKPVVLSAAAWRSEFQADMAVVGRTVTVDGQPGVIIGVMRPDFWFFSRKTSLWTLLPRNAPPMVIPGANWRARFIGVVLRLAPGTNPDGAETALGQIARGNRVPWNGAFPELKSLDEVNRPAFYVGAVGLVLTLLLLLAAAILPVGPFSLRAMAGLPFSKASRYWWFFVGKTVLLLALLIAVWLEFMLGIRDPVVGFLSSWLFLLACVLVAVVTLVDQRRRCPVCLHRLTMPVSMGTYASPLLDPASTELLCDQGHGMLTVPQAETSASAPERWTELDESWRELFLS